MRLFIPILAAALLAASVATAQQQDDAEGIVVVTNPTLRAILETDRKTPADHARAAFALVDLGEAELAKEVVAELVALDLDDKALAELVAQFGSGPFVKLSRTLGPEAAEFASIALAAARAQAVDPERLAGLVKQLGSPSQNERASALLALERTGADGVAYCLKAFASQEDDARNRLREGLVALGPLSRDALVAMLDSSDADLRKQAAWAVGRLGDRAAVPVIAALAVLEPKGSDPARAAQWAMVHLTQKPSDTALATRLLDEALRDARRGVPPAKPNGMGEIALYQRSADSPLATEPLLLPAADAGVVHSAWLARLKLRLDPSSMAARKQALILHLQSQALLEPHGVALPEEELLDMSEIPSDQLSSALSDALELRYAGAATALAVKLGDRGSASVLITGDGRPSPLAVALEAPHPAVRWSALRAVRAMKPQTPFPGSSRVADALVHFAGGGAGRLAVAATPSVERSATLAGYLASEGIEARVTNNGAEAVKLADAADIEFVLVDLAILRPNVRETVFRLRRQTTSGGAPIGLLAPDGRLEEAKRIAADHQNVLAFPRPHNAEAVAEIAAALTAATPYGWPTAEERAELASIARDWIAEMLEETLDDSPDGSLGADLSFYNLRGKAAALQESLVRAGYTEKSVAALGLLGTPDSQRELLTAAGLATLPEGLRRAAADAFKQSTERFGVLLTTDEIENQYNLYNASESLDPATQEVLAGVLDAIEAKRGSRQEAAGSRQ